MELLFAEKIFTGKEILKNIYIGTENGKITYMSDVSPNTDEYVRRKKFVCPGFIDIHTHGALGIDTNSASPEDLLKIAEYNEKCGLSAFMPTAVTDSYENIEKIISNVGKAVKMQEQSGKGAEILGLFLEGIFINPLKRGSHLYKYIKAVDLEFIREIAAKHNKILKRAIIAPELENAEKAIKIFRENGIKVCIGHSTANYDESLRALKCGADCAVHIYNAMGNFDHRNSGILSASLLEDIYGEIICDFVHTDKNAVKLLLKCKGHDKIILVTDNMCTKGTKGGRYKLGEVDIFIENGRAVTKDGTLAGGNSDISDAVKNMILLGVDTREAINMGSLNPAKYLGIDDRYGTIEIGKSAKLFELPQ